MPELREALADVQHAIWSHWMQYMFTQGTYAADGSFTLPPEKVERWTRQMTTPYADLSDREQESDRTQADKTLGCLSLQE